MPSRSPSLFGHVPECTCEPWLNPPNFNCKQHKLAPEPTKKASGLYSLRSPSVTNIGLGLAAPTTPPQSRPASPTKSKSASQLNLGLGVLSHKRSRSGSQLNLSTLNLGSNNSASPGTESQQQGPPLTQGPNKLRRSVSHANFAGKNIPPPTPASTTSSLARERSPIQSIRKWFSRDNLHQSPTEATTTSGLQISSPTDFRQISPPAELRAPSRAASRVGSNRYPPRAPSSAASNRDAWYGDGPSTSASTGVNPVEADVTGANANASMQRLKGGGHSPSPQPPPPVAGMPRPILRKTSWYTPSAAPSSGHSESSSSEEDYGKSAPVVNHARGRSRSRAPSIKRAPSRDGYGPVPAQDLDQRLQTWQTQSPQAAPPVRYAGSVASHAPSHASAGSGAKSDSSRHHKPPSRAPSVSRVAPPPRLAHSSSSSSSSSSASSDYRPTRSRAPSTSRNRRPPSSRRSASRDIYSGAPTPKAFPPSRSPSAAPPSEFSFTPSHAPSRAPYAPSRAPSHASTHSHASSRHSRSRAPSSDSRSFTVPADARSSHSRAPSFSSQHSPGSMSSRTLPSSGYHGSPHMQMQMQMSQPNLPHAERPDYAHHQRRATTQVVPQELVYSYSQTHPAQAPVRMNMPQPHVYIPAYPDPNEMDNKPHMTINPILRSMHFFTQSRSRQLRGDLRFPSSLSLHKRHADEPATNPATRKMYLVFADFPWVISVKNNRFITIRDIVSVLYSALNENISLEEYQDAPEWKRKQLKKTLMHACEAYPDLRRMDDSVRRIDWCNEMTLFGGIAHVPDVIADRMEDRNKWHRTWVVQMLPWDTEVLHSGGHDRRATHY